MSETAAVQVFEPNIPMEAVQMDGDNARTTSMAVAQVFGKRHDNVMDAIKKLMASEAVRGRLIFKESSYVNEQNKKQPCFTMTRTGFDLLAMGFTGEKALAYKLAYIDRFQFMETQAIQIAMTATKKTLLEAHAVAVNDMQLALTSAHREELERIGEAYDELEETAAKYRDDSKLWMQRAHFAEEEAANLRVKASPVHKFGEMGTNGLPRTLHRRGTTVARKSIGEASLDIQAFARQQDEERRRFIEQFLNFDYSNNQEAAQ